MGYDHSAHIYLRLKIDLIGIVLIVIGEVNDTEPPFADDPTSQAGVVVATTNVID